MRERALFPQEEERASGISISFSHFPPNELERTIRSGQRDLKAW